LEWISVADTPVVATSVTAPMQSPRTRVNWGSGKQPNKSRFDQPAARAARQCADFGSVMLDYATRNTFGLGIM
jgi:hypothetical protein